MKFMLEGHRIPYREVDVSLKENEELKKYEFEIGTNRRANSSYNASHVSFHF